MEWEFAFDRAARAVLAPLGIWPSTARVRVTTEEFAVDFGPWRLRTTVDNIRAVTTTGPYRWVKAIGPHLSVADRGVTFGTNGDRGVCVCFRRPVPALLPVPAFTHPAVTVTVVDPESLAAYLERRLDISHHA